ncbi:MAG: 2-amino-4-hydroxy-6-hydroxymethyldihydropteridine diphosphokinase [Fermentimonas sp.]|nr:2-amino-4-hydroxy-6-hydroxymethyldihydropteridine diphosphokinase [Fermentimonas sp.]
MNEKENRIFSVFLSIGSNLGNKEKNIETAYKNIEKQIGEIKSSSAFFYSSPEGFVSENDFVNSACEVISNMNVCDIFAATQRIEKEMGRIGKSVGGLHSDRIIDIDILMIDNLIIESPELTIPHPRFHKRNFVLTPLCEIAPEVIHPVLNKSIQELKDIEYGTFRKK